MSVTSLTDYTEIHEALLKQLQDAIDRLIEANNTLTESRNDLATHNSDGEAHQDIRALLNSSESTSTEQVDERIQQHNVNKSAHPDIRSLIEQVRNDTSAAQTLITQLISQHNTSGSAHADIRELINRLSVQLGSLNLSEVSDKLDELWTYVHTTITNAITQLQNVDARHDSMINANTNSIKELNNRMDNVSGDLVNIANSQTEIRNDIDEVILKHDNLENEELNGVEQSLPNGPNLVKFTTNLPTYISNNKAIKFMFSGATGHAPENPITIAITQLNGDYTISKYTDITLGEELTFTAGTNAAGAIMNFIAKVTDTVTSVTCGRIFSVMASRPLSGGSISLPGLTDLGGVEPGVEIEFTIASLVDDGSGRYTYKLDPLQTGITFSPKSEGIKEGETITIKIPEEAPRDTDLTFNLTVEDTQGGDTTMEIVVHVNRMPDLEDFEHNVPAVVVPGRTYQLKFSGVVSASDRDATYAVESSDSKVTFSKKTGILANENCAMTVGSDITRGSTVTLTVTTSDENDIHLTKQIQFKVNQLPTATDVTTTLAGSARGGQTIQFQINGGSDPDSLSRTVASYSIDAGSSSFVFSKTVGITAGENVSVTLPKVSADSARSFTIKTVDDMGETSTEAYTVNVTVTPIYIADTPRITSPANGAELEYEDGVTVIWTEFTYHADVS